MNSLRVQKRATSTETVVLSSELIAVLVPWFSERSMGLRVKSSVFLKNGGLDNLDHQLTSDENGDVANDEIRPIGIDALVNAFVVLRLNVCAQVVSVGLCGRHRSG